MTDSYDTALSHLLERQDSIAQMDGFATTTSDYCSPFTSKIEDVLSTEESPFTTLTLPKNVGPLAIASTNYGGKRKIQQEMFPVIVDVNSSTTPLDPSILQSYVEKTQLYDKGIDKHGDKMNVVGGVGIIKGIPHLDFSNLHNFVTQSLPRGVMAECVVHRTRGLHPKYEMYLEKENLFLLAAKNELRDYVISTVSSDISKTSTHYAGKVSQPFMSSFYRFLSAGKNPKHLTSDQEAEIKRLSGAPQKTLNDHAEALGMREELGILTFIKLYLPKVNAYGNRLAIRPLQTKSGMIETPDKDGSFYTFVSRTPHRNPKTNKYQMDFHGRAKVASVKNYQLIPGSDPTQSESEIPTFFQFGKIDTDSFTLDFAFPFSPFQAFCVGLAIFDTS